MSLWNLFRQRKTKSPASDQAVQPASASKTDALEPSSVDTEAPTLSEVLSQVDHAKTDSPTKDPSQNPANPVSDTEPETQDLILTDTDSGVEPSETLDQPHAGTDADLVVLHDEPPRPSKIDSVPGGPPKPEVVISLSHKEIATMARSLWESRGMPHGQDEVLWHEAEDILREKRLMELAKSQSQAAG